MIDVLRPNDVFAHARVFVNSVLVLSALSAVLSGSAGEVSPADVASALGSDGETRTVWCRPEDAGRPSRACHNEPTTIWERYDALQWREKRATPGGRVIEPTFQDYVDALASDVAVELP